MELTIEQALRQGLAAHNSGNLQEAERLYRAILQSEPTHPDANHNLGVLAVSVNKAEAALPLFKIALEANRKIEQFWLSYIGALIKEKQFENAKQVIEQGKTQGVAEEKLNVLETQLPPTAQVNEPKLAVQNKGLSLSQKRKKLSEKKKQKKAKKQNLKANNPSQQQLSSLLEHHQNGRFSDAEKLATSITQEFPTHQFAWKVLGAVLGATGRKSEALDANQKAVALSPQDAEAHNNLGITLNDMGRIDEAEASYRQGIGLKPDYAEAHSNLGNTLKELGRLEDAEASYTQALEFKPDFAEAHCNLGVTLRELGRLDEAEASYTQAIALKPDFAQAHSNLAKVLYQLGYKDSALESIENANGIDPDSQEYELILSVIKARKPHWEGEVAIGGTRDIGSFTGLTSNPLKLQRAVEAGLITKLYEMNSTVKKNVKNDARFGTRSSEFNLLGDSSSIIQSLAADLTRIMMEAVKADVYIIDSFFNILSAGGGTTPHRHLSGLDKDIAFNLGKQKYSLQYYVSVGDQNCSEPGMLKLYEPAEGILPDEGMITIIPASRMHSAVYGGKTNRVMIGVNFYSL